MFVFYNPNPTGMRVGDCVIRAICKATGLSWDDVYLSLFVEGFEKKDMPSSNDVWASYLRSLGFDREPIPNTCPDCYRVRDFCLDHPDGAYILVCQSHVVAAVDGDFYDTWDSSEEPIYFYWVKE